MIGKEVTLRDIVLEFTEPQPVDLHCEEELPEQDTEVEPERTAYKIILRCGGGCGTKLRLFVAATQVGIRGLQDLLLEEVVILCPDCRNSDLQHGGQ